MVTRMMLRTIQLTAVCLALAVTAGCSPDSGKAAVTGTVTLDGQPLKSGLIRFIPADGRTPTAEATITDGEFTAQVPLGEKRVSISAPKLVGKRKAYETPDSPTVDIVEELLPARYNVTSELTLRVTGGRQKADFMLESAK
jgi:hypothetical protein